MIKIICAWCGKDMGEKDGGGITGVSHAICQECFEKEINRKNEEEDEDENSIIR